MRIVPTIVICIGFCFVANVFCNPPLGNFFDDNGNLYDETKFTILDAHYNHNFITPYKFLDGQKNTYIFFIRDSLDNYYVIKQEKDITLHRQFGVISEALSAYVAKTIGIPSQQVQIIPVNIHLPGKLILGRVATLHSFIQGDTIRSMAKTSHVYEKLDIKQDTDSNTPLVRQGLTERTVFWMSQHPDLPSIVALDTFFGNPDRNKANLIFNKETDSFYAIDMASMYDIFSDRTAVAHSACDQITIMIDEKKLFSQEELEALSCYRETLKKLIMVFPPSDMIVLLDYFFNQTGITHDFLFTKKDIDTVLFTYKRAIKQSYVAVKRLVYLLFILIENNKKINNNS